MAVTCSVALTLPSLTIAADVEQDGQIAWQRLEKARQTDSQNGQTGGSKPKQPAQELRKRIRELALAYRARTPYHRYTANTGHLIANIASELNTPPDTVRGHLKILRLKQKIR